MQPYIPYIVLEAHVAERLRDAERYRREPAWRPRLMLRRQLGTWLVRTGMRLQPAVPASQAA